MTDSRTRSVVVASELMMLACLCLGLLAGGMLVIGVAFVSFWKSFSPSDFQTWFASYSHLIGQLMIPLGGGSVAATAIGLGARDADGHNLHPRGMWPLDGTTDVSRLTHRAAADL